MRLKVTLEYDGSGFRGWAAQPGLRTVERVLREALDRVFSTWSELAVAGRTDTGVHALAQVASVEAKGGPPPERAAEALNAELPDKHIFCLDPVICPCSTMYRVHPAYVLWSLEHLAQGKVVNQITVDPETAHHARVALDQMLALPGADTPPPTTV